MDSATHIETKRPPAQSNPKGSPVDLTQLRRYTMGNSDLEREILGLFAEQATAAVDQLRNATSSTAWREAAHTLKGTALYVGAWTVAKCAQQAEVDGYSSATRDVLIERLDHAADEAAQFIASL